MGTNMDEKWSLIKSCLITEVYYAKQAKSMPKTLTAMTLDWFTKLKYVLREVRVEINGSFQVCVCRCSYTAIVYQIAECVVCMS